MTFTKNNKKDKIIYLKYKIHFKIFFIDFKTLTARLLALCI